MGESPSFLTQSLCSPWTHDFRDCACFYWASNHPDIALPPLPAPPPAAGDPRWEQATAWERADRSVATPPVARQTGSQSVPEIAHHAINRDWQLLNFVLERRERISDYAPTRFNAVPLPNQAALLAQLRYAAGVEIAAMQEYLTAAWSLRPGGAAAGGGALRRSILPSTLTPRISSKPGATGAAGRAAAGGAGAAGRGAGGGAAAGASATR